MGVLADKAKSKEEIRQQLDINDAILQYTREGVVVTDPSGTILWVNPAFSKITGYAPDEVMGQNPRMLKSQRHSTAFYKEMWRAILQEGLWQGEIWNRRKSGEVYPEQLTIKAIYNDSREILKFVSIFNDLSEIIRHEELIQYQKYHDSLTGLPNRFLMMDRLSMAIARAYQEKHMLAFMFLDIDRFKRINDTLGHVVGDELIQLFAKRLKYVLRDGDTISRMVGDEFAILLERIPNGNAAIVVAEKIIQSMKEPFYIKNHDIHITTSIGISLYPEDGKDPELLLKHAEMAMQQAKRFGLNNYRLYSIAMSHQVRLKMELETEIRSGLSRNEFYLYYQPQVNIYNESVNSAETLMRWNHPQRGLVSPGDFIPVAEETGLIVSLGEFAMKQAFMQSRKWSEEGKHIVLSFNLSPTQFQQLDLYEQIESLLKTTGAKPELLELEVTESTTMLNPEFAAETLKRIKKLGIRVAMDDFGTGYSSLSLLSRLPVDKLKIDRSFVTGIETSQDKQAIVSAMVGMGRKLGMTVVAEGVEKTSERDYMVEIGCDLIQGYLYSKPLPLEDFEQFYLEHAEHN